jgi:hypothetical protein
MALKLKTKNPMPARKVGPRATPQSQEEAEVRYREMVRAKAVDGVEPDMTQLRSLDYWIVGLNHIKFKADVERAQMGLFEGRSASEASLPPPRTLAQVAGDTAYGIVTSTDLDLEQKRDMLMGLLDLFDDVMGANAESGSGLDGGDADPNGLSIGPQAKKSKVKPVAESELLDLLTDHTRDERRRLLEAGRTDKEPRFDLRSLLN